MFLNKKQFFSLGNPAANCGLRIFALKKLLEFLQHEIKNNQHVFQGNILQQRKIVEALCGSLKELNDTIVPDGTIKQISIASNKSHKKALFEQLKKFPERNMKSIMDGVRRYISSEEFDNQKALLVELACQDQKKPTINEYVSSTDWLLEMLVCIGKKVFFIFEA